MRFYILHVRPNVTWPLHDANMRIIVCAASSGRARKLAQEAARGDENTMHDRPWLDAKLTSCKSLRPEEPERVILADFHPG